MKTLKRLLGYFWMITGPIAIIFLIYSAIKNVNSNASGDITNPVPWIIIIAIFIPIAIGFTIFGWYAVCGEYDGYLTTEDIEEAHTVIKGRE